jgi:hypothetical protein
MSKWRGLDSRQRKRDAEEQRHLEAEAERVRRRRGNAGPLAGQRVAGREPPPEVPQARLSAPTLVETLTRPNAIDERVDQDDGTHHSGKDCELPHGHILPGGTRAARARPRVTQRTGAHKTSPLTKSPADVHISGEDAGQDA